MCACVYCPPIEFPKKAAAMAAVITGGTISGLRNPDLKADLQLMMAQVIAGATTASMVVSMLAK